jgi:GT2 family glycosyltransferase
MPNAPETSIIEAAIVLVHYGDPALTQRCLDSLAAIETTPHRVFIADHGPGRLADALKTSHPSAIVLERANLGFAAGCNAAAQAAFEAGCRWIWLLNNDATLAKPTLAPLLEQAQKAPGLWGTFQLDGERKIGADHLPRWFPELPTAAKTTFPLPEGCRQLDARETLSGASILLSKETWETLGPLPEWCFLYWEDTTWCLRAHQLGIPLFMSDLHIVHPRGTTTGRHSPLTTYYGVRNMLLLHAERWPEATGARRKQAFHLLQKRLFQARLGMLRPTLQGIRDAGRGVRGRKP